MHDRRSQALGQGDDLVVRAMAARAAQDRDAPVAVEHRRQAIEIGFRRRDHRYGRQEANAIRDPGVGRGQQRHVPRQNHDGDAALADRLADRHLERPRHLVRAGDQLTIVAALLEQRLGMRLLEIAGADFRGRHLRRDSEHRDARAVATE
jgi:hypothetical protein